MLDYIVLEGSNAGILCLDVDKAARHGYEPIGGVAVVTFMEGGQQIFLFFQAMIKEDQTSLFAEKLRAFQRRGWTLDEAIANTLDKTLEEANAEDQG
jgi:hypothetical protein